MLFAVGDVHGHAAELQALQQLMGSLGSLSDAHRKCHVYLGDYIDRGPDIRRTLELLMIERARRDGVERVFLAGNHDQFLIELLRFEDNLGVEFITHWFDNGGESTLRALGVEGYGRLFYARRIGEFSELIKRSIGSELQCLLDALQPMHCEGEYVFVHAGIDPSLDLQAQDLSDLLLIREPFLSLKDWRHPFCVVHGHSISMPTVLSHRIGVDAGCYRNGVLCAVQLERDRLRFVGTTAIADYPWQQQLGGRAAQWIWSEPQPISSLLHSQLA